MKGLQIVAYVGAERQSIFRRPVGAEKIIKSWAPDEKRARQEKRRMEREHGGIVVIRRTA